MQTSPLVVEGTGASCHTGCVSVNGFESAVKLQNSVFTLAVNAYVGFNT